MRDLKAALDSADRLCAQWQSAVEAGQQRETAYQADLTALRQQLAEAKAHCQAAEATRDALQQAFESLQATLTATLEQHQRQLERALDRLEGAEARALREIDRVKQAAKQQEHSLEKRLSAQINDLTVQLATCQRALREARQTAFNHDPP